MERELTETAFIGERRLYAEIIQRAALDIAQDAWIYPECCLDNDSDWRDCQFADQIEKKEDCRYWREIMVTCPNHTENVTKNNISDINAAVPELPPTAAPKNNEQEGKPDPTLLPMDLLIKYVVPAYQQELKKYWRESWRHGFQVSVMVAAAMRHISDFFWNCEDYDPDAEQYGIQKHHLAGAIFSLLSILNTLDAHPEMDDRRRKTNV